MVLHIETEIFQANYNDFLTRFETEKLDYSCNTRIPLGHGFGDGARVLFMKVNRRLYTVLFVCGQDRQEDGDCSKLLVWFN